MELSEDLSEPPSLKRSSWEPWWCLERLDPQSLLYSTRTTPRTGPPTKYMARRLESENCPCDVAGGSLRPASSTRTQLKEGETERKLIIILSSFVTICQQRHLPIEDFILDSFCWRCGVSWCTTRSVVFPEGQSTKSNCDNFMSSAMATCLAGFHR